MSRARSLAAAAIVAAAALAVAAGGAAPLIKITNVKPPAVSGQARNGSILTSSRGSWQLGPHKPGLTPSYAFAWLRCGPGGGSCSALPGETNSTYLVRPPDAGHTLRSHVTASIGASSLVAESAPTAVVPAVAGSGPPVAQAPPAVTGTAAQGSSLAGTPGTWSGTQPITFSYQWLRCDAGGATCGAIPGATSATIALGSDDTGKRLKLRVTARNAQGSAQGFSQPSGVVAAPGAGGGSGAVDVASLTSTDRLQMNTVQFTPAVLTTRDPFTLRVVVTDAQGQRVRGALVYAIALPYGLVRPAAEVASDGSGYATLQLVPTTSLQVGRPGSIQFFLRARRAGDDLLGGISNRRLIQVSVR